MIDKKYEGEELKRILAADIEKLTPNELKIRLKALEEKIALTPASVVENEKHPTDLRGVGPDDFVYINMVAGPMGDIFNINGIPYPPGRIKVKRRVAESLQYYVSEAYKIERERLISRSNAYQGALLRGEDLASVERFNEILREN